MSKQRVTFSVLLGLALLVPGVILAQPAGPQAAAVPSAPTGSTLFVENAGQWPDAARFQVWGSPAGVGTTWLAQDAIWVVVGEVRGSEVRETEGQKSDGQLDLTSDLPSLTPSPTSDLCPHRP